MCSAQRRIFNVINPLTRAEARAPNWTKVQYTCLPPFAYKSHSDGLEEIDTLRMLEDYGFRVIDRHVPSIR